jgi:hypothetical protein
MLQVEKVGGKRLIIKSKQPQSSRYFYKLASMALDQTFGYLNGEQIKDIEDGIYISW